MSFRVFWTPDAEAKLEALLRESDTPSELAEVAIEIDRTLATDPTGFGESRIDAVRIAFIRPLAIQFDVIDDMQTVIVDAVWRTDRK